MFKPMKYNVGEMEPALKATSELADTFTNNFPSR